LKKERGELLLFVASHKHPAAQCPLENPQGKAMIDVGPNYFDSCLLDVFICEELFAALRK
jgi:hypothetical protein